VRAPLIALLLLAAGNLSAADWLADSDAKTLHAAGVRADDAGLLAYLGSLRPLDGVRRQVKELVGHLGDDNFPSREQAMRQLTKLAAFAVDELQEASRGSDREVARRAKAILAEYEAGADQREDVLLAVLRTLARKKTVGAVPVLLDTPTAWERRDFRKAAEKSLNACYRPADAEALTRSLHAVNPHLRAAAAVCLLNQGDRRSLAVLGRLLDSPELEIRNRAGRVLRAVSGRDFGFVAYAGPEAREKAAAAARRWIEAEGRTANLTRPAPVESLLGKILMCCHTEGRDERVIELDENGKKIWEKESPGVFCCQGLADGHRLAGSLSGRVGEYDAQGEVVWSLEKTPDPVMAVQRAANGRTLLALGSIHRKSKLQVIRADKSVCSEVDLGIFYPWDMQLLENGGTLVADQFSRRIIEVSRRGRVLGEWKDIKGPSSVQRLDNGNTLVCEGLNDRVVEVDRGGRVVWSHNVSNPRHAQRLPNGHTIIADLGRLLELDAKGNSKVLWEFAEEAACHFHAY
jgi:hypothetical protein